MLFAAETLTDPAAQAAAQQVVQAAVRYDVIAITAAISVLATSGLGGFFIWLYNRRKTNSEVDLNDSQAELNDAEKEQISANIIRGLLADINGFIEQVRGLRDQIDAVKAEKKAADQTITAVKENEAAARKQLAVDFAAEKAKISETVVRAIDSMSKLEIEVDKCENPSAIRRQTVLVVELLYYIKRLLTG
jgi:hypothetical protein